MIVGLGVDVVEIGRVRQILQSQAERFVRRVFTAAERDYCNRHRDSAPHYAARFAAKEALFKALGTGWAQGVGWLDVEVGREGAAPPDLRLHGEAARRSRAGRGVLRHPPGTRARAAAARSEPQG